MTTTRHGERSEAISYNSMYLLFDIGGTHMRLAISDGVRIGNKRVVKTPDSYAQGLMLFEEISLELLGTDTPDCIAGGFAAPIDQQYGKIGKAVNLEEWSYKELAHDLMSLYAVPIILENDAALGALGEAVYGAGKDYERVAYITLGTGVGGFLIIDQRFGKDVPNFEPGHMLISDDGTKELFAWGEYVRKYNNDESQLHFAVAVGVHNIIVLWAPDAVVLGGGLINHAVIKTTLVEKSVKHMLYIFDKSPAIVSNNLGDDSVLFGAMELANRSK